MAKSTLSRIRNFLEAFEGKEIHVGVDVHKMSYSIAVRRIDGACETWVAPAKPYDFVHSMLELGQPIKRVVYESGPTGFSLCRAVEEAGIDCWVVAPSKIPRAVSQGSKTDRLDCIKLADYAAKEMLKPIAVPSAQEEGERSLIRRRSQIIDKVRSTKHRIKSLLLFVGADEPHGLTQWSQKGVAELAVMQLEPSIKLTLDSHLRELGYLKTELKEIELTLKTIMQQQHEEPMKRLCSVPGVGPTVATTFLLELYRPERFQRQEEVSSYLGLAPVIRQSGDRSSRGRLVPVGQKRLRSLLVEAAWIWQAKEPKAKEYYNKLFAKNGLAQKTIVALARHLAVLLWKLSLPRRTPRPFNRLLWVGSPGRRAVQGSR